MLGWLGNLDPFGFYQSQHTCEGSNNYQGYCDPETDALLMEAATETDEDARKALYDEAVERIVDANSYIYLYNPTFVTAWSPDPAGYANRPARALHSHHPTLGGG